MLLGAAPPGSFLTGPARCRRAPGRPPRTPGWLEGLRALRFPHLSRGWQEAEGLRAHKVPFLTPQRFQSPNVWTAPPNPELSGARNLPVPLAKQTRSAANRRVTRRGPGAATAEACAGLHGRGSPQRAAVCPAAPVASGPEPGVGGGG